MADLNPSATELATELGAYFRANNRQIIAALYQKSVTAQYMRTIPAQQGKFPALQSITSDVVQGFTAVWTPMGVTEFKVNPLVAYQQKVNFPITPAQVQNSWIAFLYEEGKKAADMPISHYIIDQELMPKVVSNRETLIGKGQYDPTKLGVFGHSMDGIQAKINQGVADGSMFKVPILAPSRSNMVDQIEEFELNLPEELKPLLDKIYMPQNLVEAYRLDYRNKHGLMPTYTLEDGMRTYLGQRKLIGLPSLNGTNIIFATPDQNFLRLIDIVDTAVITDVQVLDYQVKIFMEWWEGVGFWTNQMVVVAVPAGTLKGLGTGVDADADAALTTKYFPNVSAPLPS
ncbi:hypothetical protein [Hymenobacter baengnokdamensis]|uniref:hypothetical protein n=1 Tax=Hymenobacter baengnokdamensis TaxID=2615203 RepID=UPI0012462570|nr:hypothetical protein [Hymenobacter baengnokdamensis]